MANFIHTIPYIQWEPALRIVCYSLCHRSLWLSINIELALYKDETNRQAHEGEQALSFENRYLCKDGSYKWLLWNAAPDFGQRVIYSVARDITEQKRTQEEREELVRKLQAALAEVKTLQEILPICSYCKNIRNDKNYWQTVEGYISHHTNTRFSHSICPSCYQREIEPQLEEMRSK